MAVAVHRGTGLASLSLTLQEMGLTMPIALDMDGEIFRRYRLPGWVFPLNYLVGRDGKVAYIDTDLELDRLEQAIIETLDAQPLVSSSVARRDG